jgi:pimeloyl-ACP methyl ester carboxylesterase
LVVHGAGGGFDQGLDFGAPLAKLGLRIIAMSPLPPDASPAAQADAHACLLDALGIEKVAIVGGSAGAPSSMQFALRHPARLTALVLVVPATFVPRPGNASALHTPPGTQLLFETALKWDVVFWALSRVAPDAGQGRGPGRARVEQALKHILPISQRRQGLLNEAAVIPSLQRYELEKIHVPTLTISCADDAFGTYDGARYTAEHIPGARFIGYETGGHLWVGHQQEMTDVIASFLKS